MAAKIKKQPAKRSAELQSPGYYLAEIIKNLRELHERFPGYDLSAILSCDEPDKRSVVIPVDTPKESPTSGQ